MIIIAQKNNYEAVRDGVEAALNESLLDQKDNYGVEWIYLAIKRGVKEAITEAIKDGTLKIDR